MTRTSQAFSKIIGCPLMTGILAFVFLAHAGTAAAGTSPLAAIGGVSPEEAMKLGEKMYRDGILPSGKPMQAIVKGDVPVEGTQFTCSNCHQRSGFGSSEGTIRTPPIDGTRLYLPLSRFKGIPLTRQATELQANDLFRPAYTDETLARAMRTGVDPAGRQMNTAMPVYDLNDRDMAILVFYLKNLSSGLEPGVTDTSLRFATIITDEVSQEDRQAMLGPLQRYISNRRLSRTSEFSVRTGAYLQEETSRGMRALSLVVWELKGPSGTWQGQLEEYYKKEPVFAILGGITYGDWAPVHRFCEDHRIPAVFPITDYPVISEKDWYTLYISKGLYQEGETAAKYLNSRDDLSKEMSVVQVFRKNRAGIAPSKAYQDAWVSLGHRPPDNVALGEETLTADFWKKLADRHKHAVVLLWLDANDFPDLENLGTTKAMPDMIFASSSLLGQRLYLLPEKERTSVYITYPYTLPQEARKYRESIETTLRNNNLPLTNMDIELKMRSLFSTLTGALAMMRNYVYRDYFVELIEKTPDLTVVPVPYPRMSFGTGQRYASKGCYVVQLSEGPKPELVKRSEWIIF
jgi:hypothetical protein